MSEKEIMYVEDALNETKLCKEKCNNYGNQIMDRELKAFVKDLEARQQQIFSQIYKVLQ